MAHDLLRGETKADWSRRTSSVGALPREAEGYAPTSWWTAAQAEAKVQELMARGGLFGTRLPREGAERRALEYLRAQKIGIMSGTMGSWLMSDKEQKRLLSKVDDVRYDIRLASRRAGIGMGLLAGALGLLGVASILKTATGEKAKGYGHIARYKE